MILLDSNDVAPFVGPLLATVFFSIYFLLHRVRRKRMIALAERYGLKYLKDELPGIYPATAINALPDAGSQSNVIYGEFEGDLLLAFDMMVGGGRSAYEVTIVARRCEDLRTVPRINDSLHSNTTDSWHTAWMSWSFFSMPGRMSASEIEAIWKRLHAPHIQHAGEPRTKLTPVADNTLIRPRSRNPVGGARADSPPAYRLQLSKKLLLKTTQPATSAAKPATP